MVEISKMFLIYSFGIFISFLGASKAVNIPSAEVSLTLIFVNNNICLIKKPLENLDL